MVEDKKHKAIECLLPYGNNIKPLITASNLKDKDLVFLLRKRGIYIDNQDRNITVPILCSTILSPKEFEILKNRQSEREDIVKRTTSLADWISSKEYLIDILKESNIRQLLDVIQKKQATYQIYKLSIVSQGRNEYKIYGEIKRNDWTKDVFSSTSYHKWEFGIKKENKVLQYINESTVPETKDLLNEIRELIHKYLQQTGAIDNKDIQKIIATDFKKNGYLSNYLFEFTNFNNQLIYNGILDVDVGLDTQQEYPSDLKWLKGHIGNIKLRAFKNEKVDDKKIKDIGQKGLIIFGEIEAKFIYIYNSSIQIPCNITYGFPNYYENKNEVEFEAKVTHIKLKKGISHISKSKIKKDILTIFQEQKHDLYQIYKSKRWILEGRSIKLPLNQYALFSENNE